jgi:hypothetical protein
MSLNLGIIASSRQQASSLLLDTYPNAAAAYSLRKLRTAYTGSAIRVRRSLDNIEFDINFLANGELDTTNLLLSCGGTNGNVVKWYDQSGNGVDATHPTGPQIVVSGVLQLQNGKPTLTQTAVNSQWLETPYSFNLAANKLASIYSITKAVELYGNYYAMRRNALADYTSGIALIATDTSFLNRINLGRGSGGSNFADTNIKDWTFNSTIQQLTSAIISTSNIAIYKNGANQTLSTSLGTMPLSDWLSTGSGLHNIILGGRNYNNTNSPSVTDPTMLGNYQEFIFYFSDQSGNNTAIQNNINSYYSIY